MRTRLILSFLALTFGAEACPGQERKVLMPEQVEEDRPQGEVTVAFRVVDVGLRDGPIRVGQPPYRPIALEAAACTEPKVGPLTRGRSRPHLVDWRRDGHADLVIGYPGHPPLQTSRPFQAGRWTLLVGSGPRAEKKDLALQPLELPPILGGSPNSYSFADWDGDGRVDLLVGVEYRGQGGFGVMGSGSGSSRIIAWEPSVQHFLRPAFPCRSAAPVAFILTFTNVGNKPVKLDTYDLPYRNFKLTITGPNAKSVRIVDLDQERKHRAPIAEDFPEIRPSGSWFPKTVIAFPGDIGAVSYALLEPGEYRVKAVYANPQVQESVFAAGSWTGSVTSNEIVLNVLPARVLDGKKDPKKADGAAATTEQFEDLAAALPIFQTIEFAAGRGAGFDFATRFMPKKQAEAWRKTEAALSAGKDDTADLVALLKHADPKIRTLALASLFDRQDPRQIPHLAAMVGDKAKTALEIVISRAISIHSGPDQLLPQDIQEQTVGHVAQVFLMRWLEPAGYTLKNFEAYWAERKERTYCANWFLARFRRAGQSTTAFDVARGTPLIRAIRKDIDALPAPDRDWTLLWLATRRDMVSDQPQHILAKPEELIAAGKRLGPDRLMDLIQEKEISTDPDLAPKQPPGSGLTGGRGGLIQWTLHNASKLLRPEDAPTLLSMEQNLRDPSPWYAIAAAELQPANAHDWLHAAMRRFTGAPTSFHDEGARAEIAAALWRIVGESEIDSLADWFFAEKVNNHPHSTQTGLFLETIKGVRAPADRKLLARLVTDPRLDKLDYQSLRSVIELVNGWTKQPVVARRDLHPAWEKGGWAPETPGDLKRLADWCSKLRGSLSEWQIPAQSQKK